MIFRYKKASLKFLPQASNSLGVLAVNERRKEREQERNRKQKMAASSCGGAIDLNYHQWWRGLHGAKTKLERERTKREIAIMVAVCGSYGLPMTTMRFWGHQSERMRTIEMREESGTREKKEFESGERKRDLK